MQEHVANLPTIISKNAYVCNTPLLVSILHRNIPESQWRVLLMVSWASSLSQSMEYRSANRDMRLLATETVVNCVCEAGLNSHITVSDLLQGQLNVFADPTAETTKTFAATSNRKHLSQSYVLHIRWNYFFSNTINTYIQYEIKLFHQIDRRTEVTVSMWYMWNFIQFLNILFIFCGNTMNLVNPKLSYLTVQTVTRIKSLKELTR